MELISSPKALIVHRNRYSAREARCVGVGGSNPSGARMRGAVSKGGGNASLADEILVGGQGVRSDPESEGFEEKYRAVIDRGRPLMNRSAKDGIRSSPHYGGEGVTHSPIAPRCLLAARYGRFMRDPRRPVGVLV
jgi:hypothetical protein